MNKHKIIRCLHYIWHRDRISYNAHPEKYNYYAKSAEQHWFGLYMSEQDELLNIRLSGTYKCEGCDVCTELGIK